MEDYLSRKASLLRDGAGARRYARYFREAPETQGKTMRALTTEDFERYRERRLRERAHGARRKRGAASPTTVNKELSFARAVFYDFMEALEDRGLPPIANPLRTRLFLPEPAPRPETFEQLGERLGRSPELIRRLSSELGFPAPGDDRVRKDIPAGDRLTVSIEERSEDPRPYVERIPAGQRGGRAPWWPNPDRPGREGHR